MTQHDEKILLSALFSSWNFFYAAGFADHRWATGTSIGLGVLFAFRVLHLLTRTPNDKA